MKLLQNIRFALIGNPGNIWLDTFLLVVLASSIIGFLSLRGCTNASLLLLLLPALTHLRPAYSSLRADGNLGPAHLVALTLALPVLVLAISQTLRQDLIVKAYDGPVRMLIAIPLMYFLYFKRVDFARLLGVVAPLAVFILVAEIYLNPQPVERWGGRFATYSVDTDMFGVYTLVLASFCLFSIDTRGGLSKKSLQALQISGLVAGMYLFIGSQTRASAMALPFLLLLWLLVQRAHRNGRMMAALSVMTLVGLGLILTLNPDALHRLSDGYREVSGWLDGSNRDSSAGLRLTFWQMSWEFFWRSPWFGYGDTGFRAYLNEPWITSFASPEARAEIFAGPHNEVLANMLRSGFLGGVSVVFLFFAPFTVFWQRRHSPDARVAHACRLGLAYLLCMIICSIGFEVFTLKYTASFYGMIIAGLAAQTIRGRRAGMEMPIAGP
jgi:O-antigen ligase